MMIRRLLLALSLALALAAPAQAQWVEVDSGTGAGVNSATTGSMDLSTGGNATVLIAHVAYFGATALVGSDVTDTSSNTWVALTPISNGSQPNAKGQFFYVINPVVTSSQSVTVDEPGYYMGITVVGLRGFTATFLSATAGIDFGVGFSSVQDASIGGSGDLVIAGTAWDTAKGSATSIDSSFSTVIEQAYGGGNNEGSAIAWKEVTGSVQPTWSWSGTSSFGTAQNISFTSSAGGGGDPIAVDSVSNGEVEFGPFECDWLHTTAGTDRIMFVTLFSTPYDSAGTPTYDGVPLTLIGKTQSDISQRWIYLWYLVAPNVGTHTVSVPSEGFAFEVCQGAAITYTGVDQTAPIEESTTNISGEATSITTTLSTSTNNAWTVLGVRSTAEPTAGAGSTDRYSEWTGLGLFDSGGPISPAGSVSMEVTSAGSYWATVMAAFCPASTGCGGGGGVTPVPRMHLLGVGGRQQ